jgi:Raf kinase inhibitor-like YbhB/YbcL family protein
MRSPVIAVAAATVALAGCGGDEKVSGPPPEAPERMTLRAPGFGNGDPIPVEYTCDGRDISPPLSWSGTPRGARELAILVEDPDAPGGTFVHWVLFGLGPTQKQLDAGATPEGSRQGRNSFGETRYRGPCPPKGDEPHRYQFSIYALREHIGASEGAAAEDVRDEIRRKAIASGRLTGRYGR